MGVPNIFGTATAPIPLTQLDANFNTTATLGNTAVGLGNTTTSVGNLALTNTTITEIQETANVTATAANGTWNQLQNAPTSINFATEPPLQFATSVQYGTTSNTFPLTNVTHTLTQFQIEA